MQIKPRSRPKIDRQVQDKKPQGAMPEDRKSQGAVPDDNKSQVSSIPADGHQVLIAYLSRALGILGSRFAAGLMDQIVKFCADGAHFDSERYKFLVACLVTSKPRNHVEAMLVLQMATMQLLYMKYGGLLLNSESPVQAELFEGIVTKLARTFQAQCEALYRSRERPIVEDVTQGTRESTRETGQRSTASPPDANGVQVAPVASDASVGPTKQERAQPRERVRPVDDGN
jgi:hypothetical protein